MSRRAGADVVEQKGSHAIYVSQPKAVVDLSSVGSPAPSAHATNIPIYKADSQSLDTELGRLLAEVDVDNTVVIFVGDNGVPPQKLDTLWGE